MTSASRATAALVTGEPASKASQMGIGQKSSSTRRGYTRSSMRPGVEMAADAPALPGLKSQYPDAILFYRMGDFYELFFDDALQVAPLLDLTLTARQKGTPNEAPMCGVPHHAVVVTSAG